MKITNIRVLNNFKVKLTNTKLSGVNASQSSIFEQGTRTPVIITEVPEEDFQEKFNLVFNYLINRYEPGWSAATIDVGKAATMQLLGISSAVNPLILGGTVSDAFNYTANNNSANIGWFDPLTHPKDFASAVLSAYKKFERARTPSSAKHRFVQYNLNGIYCQDFLPQGGNAFFGYHPNFNWRPGTTLPKQLYMGYTANYNNGICRTLIHSPYGNFTSPMNSLAGNWRRYPWLSDRYTAESFQFDMYLLSQENSTIRDLLSDYNVERSITGGVLVNGTGDAHLNTTYRGMCFPAGTYTKYPSYNDHGRTFGGFSANQVLVGSPWISFPNGITFSDWWGGGLAGLCFNPETLVLFDGSTFSNNPTDFSSVLPRPPMTNVTGLSFGYGQSLLQSLNDLSSQYGNSMEFIAYLGCLPYGPGFEMRIPFGLYRDPTVEGNKEYFKWRLDASVSHWKEKFKSPVDGFAHVYMDASSLIERTYHQWQESGYTLWTNIASSGASYVENIPVEWARDQYNYTFGDLGPNATAGVVLGVERFAQYMFKDDVGLANPSRNDQRRFNGDTEPRHWCLDDDKATDLLPLVHDMFLGQRKWGLTYSNSIWGMGVCGSSELGEIHSKCIVQYMDDSDKSVMSGFPFFYNTFINVTNSGDIKWKRVPNTLFDGTTDGVPWVNDRRFRLFYLYPAMLALNMSILDHFHDGVGYYNIYNRSGWFDKSLGDVLEQDMETMGIGSVVSDFPHEGRRTPTKPPQNFWTGYARTSEFELLYACMKGGITDGLDSLYFDELYEELKNGLIDPPDTSRTGFFRALDFGVWAASWNAAATGEDGQSLYPSIVPVLHADNIPGLNQNYFRYADGPGSTAGMTSSSDPYNGIFEGHKRLADQIPYERRILKPQYWLLDGPPGFHRQPHYYFKKLADGTTYTGTAGGLTFLSNEFGGTWEFGDTVPLRFLTPWAYENRSIAKQSFLNFLKQAKNVDLRFKYLHDDSEAWGDQFSVGGPYLSRTDLGSTLALQNWANDPNNSFKVIPDARQTYAIVNDARFNGITSSITNRTFAQEFKHWYNGLTHMAPNEFQGVCGASAESLLSYYTNVNSRQDFKNAYANDEVRKTGYAWAAANYVFCQGDLKAKIIGDSLKETSGFEDTVITSSEVHELNAVEAKYAVDSGGGSRGSIKLPNYGHSHHSYGEMQSYLVNDYGYPPVEPTDDSTRYGKRFGFHPVSEGGITFGNRAYQAMIINQKRVRGILRSRPQAPSEGLNFLITAGPQDAFNSSVGFTGQFSEEYYKEDIFHHLLAGTNYFIVFNTRGTTSGRDLSRVNSALVEWKTISGNKVATPCDYSGATGGTVDRIDLYEAGRNCVVSGAYVGDVNTRLWRITVPPFRNTLTKTSTSQPDLPDTINIPAGSKGVWLVAPASYGKPEYQSGTAHAFFLGNGFNSPVLIEQPTWFNKAAFSMSFGGGYIFARDIYQANIGNTADVFYETSLFDEYPLNPPNNPRNDAPASPWHYLPGPTFISDSAEFKFRTSAAYLRENGANEQERVTKAFNKNFASSTQLDVLAKYKPDIVEVDINEVLEQPLMWRSNVQVMTAAGMTGIGHTVMLDRTPSLDFFSKHVSFAHERGMKIMGYFKPFLYGLNRTYYPPAKAITGFPQRYYGYHIIPRTIYNPEYQRVLKEVMQEIVRPRSEGGLGFDGFHWDYTFVYDHALDFSDYALDVWAKHKGYLGYTDAAYTTWAVTDGNFPFPDSGLTMGVLAGTTWMYNYGDLEGTALHDLVNNPNLTTTQKTNLLEYKDVLIRKYEEIIFDFAKAVKEASHGNAAFCPADDWTSQIHRSEIMSHENLVRFAQGKKTEQMLEPRGFNRLRPRSAFYTQEEYDTGVGPGWSSVRNPPVSVLAGTKEAEKKYADINVPDADTIFNIQYRKDYFADSKTVLSWHEMASSFTRSNLPVGGTGSPNNYDTFNTLDYLNYPTGGWLFSTAGWGREDCITGFLRGVYQKNLKNGYITYVSPLSQEGWKGDISKNDSGTTGDAYYNVLGTISAPRANYSWYRKLFYHHRKMKEILQNSGLPYDFKKPYAWIGIHYPTSGRVGIQTTTNYMGNFSDPGFRYIKQHEQPDLWANSNYTYKTNSANQNFGQFYHPIAGAVEVFEKNMIPYTMLQDLQMNNGEFNKLEMILIPHREFVGTTMETKLSNFVASGGKVLYMDEVFGGTAQFATDDPRLKGRFYDLDSRDSEKQKLLDKIIDVGGIPPAIGEITKYEYDGATLELTNMKQSGWYRYSNIDSNDSFVVGVHLLNDMNWMDDRKNGGQSSNFNIRFNELDPTSVPMQSSNPKLNGVLDIDLWGYGPNWRQEYNALGSNPDPSSGVPWPLGGASGGTASMFYPESGTKYWGRPLVGGYNGKYWSCKLSIKLPSVFKIESVHKFYVDQENEPNDIAYERKATSQISTDALGLSADHIAYRYDSASDSWKIYVNNIGMHADVRFKISPK